MSRQANPTLIGTFVFVALIIAIGAVIILGNLQLQQSPVRCILYFTGSLYGLDKGAPVSLRGVQIGRVTDIRIDFNYQESNYTIPVSIEIDRETEEDTQAHPLFREKLLHQSLNELIGKGLRAQLKTSSLVTGKLYIDLGFYPETPVKLHEQETELLEIPTLPSDLEQLTQNLAELPLKELFTKTNQLLDWVNQALASEEIAESMEGMHHAILGIDELVTAMKRDAPALVQHADKGLDTLITLGTEATRLVHSVDRQLSPLGEASQQTIADVRRILEVLNATVRQLEDMVDETSNITYDFSQTLLEIQRASRSVKDLSDMLQQAPESLLFGRKEQAQNK